MKNIISLAAAAVLAVFVIAFGLGGLNTIEPGEVGIKVVQFGDNRGMQQDTMGTGMHWNNPITTDVIVYDTRLNQYVIDALPTGTKDGQPITVDVSAEIGLVDARVPDLHESIGDAWFDKVVYPAIRSSVRNTTSQYQSDEVYTGDARRHIQASLEKELTSKLEPHGIRIQVNLRDLQFTNQGFVRTLEQKAEAAQRVIIEQRNAETAQQSAIKVANIAEGEKQK